jgi:hypothetical protein
MQKMEPSSMMKPNIEPLEIGGGLVEPQPSGWRMTLPPIPAGYADAQLDDYHGLPRAMLSWEPPVRLQIRARAHPTMPLGTLGFGFWNDPFTVSLGQGGTARRLPSAPQAAWFFYGSPPNDMALANGVPGHGWKASVLRSVNIPSLLLLPGAAIAAVLGLIPVIRGPVMRLARRFVHAQEKLLPSELSEWHEYRLDWNIDGVAFWVDGKLELLTDIEPRPPLGLVIWIDNQYAVASPQGGFRFGTLKTETTQWLEIESLEIETPGAG